MAVATSPARHAAATGGLAGTSREDLYEVLRPIGSGSFGQVFLVQHKRDRRQYVMKSIELKSTTLEGKEAAELEVRLLSAVRHPNIVAYRESFVDHSGHLCIFMEYCEHGDVAVYLQEAKKAGKVPDEAHLLEWFIQISLALHALHFKKILHRDLKTQNIFLTGHRQHNAFALKLGDFGIATVLNSTHELAKTQIGTPFYMSPELINNKPYSYKSDIWGLGCVLYEIVNGQRAFDAQGLNGLALKIIKGHYTPITSACSPSTRSLIKSMLNKTPKNRPTLKEILHLSSLRPRIPEAQRNVISAGPQESRAAIEQALNNQLATLGLGALVNYPGPGPRRDQGRTLQRLERARRRKLLQEEELQRTAALLAQCLGEVPASSGSPARGEQDAGGHPPRDGDHRRSYAGKREASRLREPSKEPLAMESPREESPEDAIMPPGAKKDRSSAEKERRREVEERRRGEVQRREELQLRRIREANLAQRKINDRKEGRTVSGGVHASGAIGAQEVRRSRGQSKDVMAPGDASSELWHVDSARRGNQNFSPRRPLHRDSRAASEPSPPPTMYVEPMPPNQVPRGSGSHYVSRSISGVTRQPLHVCLEAIEPADKGKAVSSDQERSSGNWFSEDSYSSGGSLSEVDEWDAAQHSASQSKERHRHSLQLRIDQCKAAISRHKMTIAMLQYTAAQTAEQESEQAERPKELPMGSGDEAGSTAYHHAFATSQYPGASQYPGGLPGAPAFVQDFAARLQRRCLEGLGLEKYRAAKRCLRSAMDASEVPRGVRDQMLGLLGVDKIAFLALLDQIVYLERRWGAPDSL